MPEKRSRRTFLAILGAVAVAGCIERIGSREGLSASTPDETPTETDAQSSGHTAGSPTATTTVDLPDECPNSPNVTGLPERPTDPDRESITSFVEEYERTLASAKNPDVVGFTRFEHVSTERVDGGYRVYLYVVPQVATSTPTETTGERSSTPTRTPESTGEYNVGYLVGEHRIVRDKRPSALTYRFSPYDGFDPRDRGDLVSC